MFECKKESCDRRDSCSHAKPHLPKVDLELACLQKQTKGVDACPGCTWIGEGKNPYKIEDIIRKSQRRTLWSPMSTLSDYGINSLAEMIDEGKEVNEILKDEGIYV